MTDKDGVNIITSENKISLESVLQICNTTIYKNIAIRQPDGSVIYDTIEIKHWYDTAISENGKGNPFDYDIYEINYATYEFSHDEGGKKHRWSYFNTIKELLIHLSQLGVLKVNENKGVNKMKYKVEFEIENLNDFRAIGYSIDLSDFLSERNLKESLEDRYFGEGKVSITNYKVEEIKDDR
jgi:hypothetical protein